MKRAIVFSAVLVMFVLPAAAAPADDAAVSVVALKIGKEIPEDPKGYPTFVKKGTSLTLVVRRADKFFVGMDKKTKLAAFTDDAGTDLLKKTGKWGMSGISSFPKFSEDGHLCVVDVQGPTPPAKGAKTIRLKATLVMKCAEGEKTAVQKDLKLKKGSKLTAGPVPWVITKVGKPDWGDAKLAVSVSGSVSHDAIKQLVFLDAAGKEIEHSVGMRSSSGWGNRMTYGVTYNLKKKVDAVTVKVIYFEKTETITIPVDLEVGVGL